MVQFFGPLSIIKRNVVCCLQGDALYKALLEALIHNSEHFVEKFVGKINKTKFNENSLYILYNNVSYNKLI